MILKIWQCIFLILPLIVLAYTIKVPIDNKEESTSVDSLTSNEDSLKNKPTYYVSDEDGLDTYLIPPDPHRPEQSLPDSIITPATYLLPPTPDKQTDYYAPTEPSGQTDWYPIAQTSQDKSPHKQNPGSIPIYFQDSEAYPVDNAKKSKLIEHSGYPVPSTHLEPPLVDAQDDYVIQTPSEELELPREEISPLVKNNFKLRPVDPAIALHLIPPKAHFTKKIPTKLYPKKATGGYKPVPIPIAQFAEDTKEPPRAKPLKYFKPISSSEIDYLTPYVDKKKYIYQNFYDKRKLKGDNEVPQIQQEAEDVRVFVQPIVKEQDTSETNYRNSERNEYPASTKQAPRPASSALASAPDGRTEFRMHGMKGPHSYQFGYDTGKGKNRQFRYEERDNEGLVKGHYGYMDKSGKLRVVNYSAHPEYGFHAEAPVEQDQ